LPLKVNGEQIAETLGSTLKKKNWHEFKLATLKLTLVPYFLFNYHYYIEKDTKGEKIIESSVDGFLALNGVSISIEKGMEKIIKASLKEAVNEAPSIPFEEKETIIEKREQEEVIKVKTAEYFKIPKQNLVISSAKKVFVPFYETFVEVKEGIFDIKINAVSGDTIGIEKVPEREKGFLEITEETINDLKDPQQWIEYTKGLLVETGKFTHKKGKHAVKAIADIQSKKNNEKNKGNNFDFVSETLTSNWLIILVILIALFFIWIGLQAI
jgi:hypothetical protein